MADGRYGAWGGRGGWGGHGGAPPPMGSGYARGWGYGYGRYGGGYQAPLEVGNENWAETGDNEVRVGNNTAPGSSIGNGNRARGSNTVVVGNSAPGGSGPGGYGHEVHYFMGYLAE